jgi:hypothetical protein
MPGRPLTCDTDKLTQIGRGRCLATTYPVNDGGSWTAGVDRAMSSDAGTTNADDNW